MNPADDMDSPRQTAAAGSTETAPGKTALVARLATLAPLIEQMWTTREGLLVALARGDRTAAVALLDQIRTWREAHAAVQSALGVVDPRRIGDFLSAEEARILALADELSTTMVNMEILLARRLAREDRVLGPVARLRGRVLAWMRRRA